MFLESPPLHPDAGSGIKSEWTFLRTGQSGGGRKHEENRTLQNLPRLGPE